MAGPGLVGEVTAIEWTDVTWNPVTGCDRTSPGCDNCYAATMAKRLKRMGNPRYLNDGDPATSGPGFGTTVHHDLFDRPRSWKKPRRVFVCSMADLFHPDVEAHDIRDLLDVMAETPHTFQVLTKRAQRLHRFSHEIGHAWPPNVWLGVSVETAAYGFRVEYLQRLRRAGVPNVLWVSAEPLLGSLREVSFRDMDWIVAGGESGAGFRPPAAAWFRQLRDYCAERRIAFTLKQWGGRTPKAGGRLLDGVLHDDQPPLHHQRLVNSLLTPPSAGSHLAGPADGAGAAALPPPRRPPVRPAEV